MAESPQLGYSATKHRCMTRELKQITKTPPPPTCISDCISSLLMGGLSMTLVSFAMSREIPNPFLLITVSTAC